ncbi:transposase [Streptomyces sp. NRRL B-2790]|uniref:transposase n=1 Tax=Streptomyces sp. NRRL B-2790 TaxID=1463835 RepID=UPI00356273DB
MQGLRVPLIVADAGYGHSVSFQLALEARGWSYVMAVHPKEIARPVTAEPHQPDYGGLGPPTLPRYREAALPLTGLVEADTFPGGHLAAGQQRHGDLALRRARGATVGQGCHPHRPGTRRRPQPVERGSAVADPAHRTVRRSLRADRLLDEQPSCHHPESRSAAMRKCAGGSSTTTASSNTA